MSEIRCPHCGEAFTIDEAAYGDIVTQVRTREFDEELHQRLTVFEREKLSAIELAEARITAEAEKKQSAKDAEVQQLAARLAEAELTQQLAVTQAVTAVEKQRDDLARDLEMKTVEQKMLESTLKEQHGKEVALLNDAIQSYRDFKARLSTKMLGETLEQHCEVSFERLRATGFQRATFGKDNDASSGSKGDYIFRESAEDGPEFISIMFEMKNEADTTATRKRNEDFLRELDKDRTEKGCEYAVLVTMLEPESELYNDGIVDVSHLYPKMYVVRPQFFIPIITLLRNAALSTVQTKAELARALEQNIDITNFEASIANFKNGFSYSYGHAQTQFDAAIKSIDDAIKDLEKTKDALRKSLGHLSAASNKADGLSIKALTRGNPTMAGKFAELEAATSDNG